VITVSAETEHRESLASPTRFRNQLGIGRPIGPIRYNFRVPCFQIRFGLLAEMELARFGFRYQRGRRKLEEAGLSRVFLPVTKVTGSRLVGRRW